MSSNVLGSRAVSVHIEWMDGQTADIEAAADPTVHEGVLRIQRYDPKHPSKAGKCISYPVANIRFWE